MRGAEAITLQVMNDTSPGAPLQRPGRAAVGSLLRAWRSKRRLSQLDLALDAGISARHLSFIETGRSLPSRATLHAIAERLDVPLRERNAMLLAAGFAPSYSESRLSDDELREVLAATRRVLDAHDPFPGLVLDRYWNVVATNRAAAAFGAALPPALVGPPLNVFRASLHPEGLARLTVNFAEWAHHLLATLRRGVERTGDERLAALLEEVSAYPNVRALSAERAAPRGRGARAGRRAVRARHPRRAHAPVHDADHLRQPARHHARRAVHRAVLPGRRGHAHAAREGGAKYRAVPLSRLAVSILAGGRAQQASEPEVHAHPEATELEVLQELVVALLVLEVAIGKQ